MMYIFIFINMMQATTVQTIRTTCIVSYIILSTENVSIHDLSVETVVQHMWICTCIWYHPCQNVEDKLHHSSDLSIKAGILK